MGLNNVRLEENLENIKTPLKKLDFKKLVIYVVHFYVFPHFVILISLIIERHAYTYTRLRGSTS